MAKKKNTNKRDLFYNNNLHKKNIFEADQNFLNNKSHYKNIILK